MIPIGHDEPLEDFLHSVDGSCGFIILLPTGRLQRYVWVISNQTAYSVGRPYGTRYPVGF